MQGNSRKARILVCGFLTIFALHSVFILDPEPSPWGSCGGFYICFLNDFNLGRGLTQLDYLMTPTGI